jgi:hypothetical protein
MRSQFHLQRTGPGSASRGGDSVRQGGSTTRTFAAPEKTGCIGIDEASAMTRAAQQALAAMRAMSSTPPSTRDAQTAQREEWAVTGPDGGDAEYGCGDSADALGGDSEALG